MDRQSLHNLLMKNVLDRSETIKMEKIRLKEIMKVVEEKVSIL